MTARGAEGRARRRCPRWLLGLGFSLGLARASGAVAQEVDLHWNAPPDCPSRAAAVERLMEYLGGEPREGARVEVTITHDRAGVSSAQILVEHAGVSGTRRLEDVDCGVLADAAVFAAAVVIDPAIEPPAASRARVPSLEPDTATTGDEAAAGSSGTDAIAESDTRRVPDATARAPSHKERDRDAPAAPATMAGGEGALILRAGGEAAVGVLPGLAPGFGLALGYELAARLRVELLGRWLPARDARLEPVPGTAGELSLADAGIRTCFLWSDDSPLFPFCAGLRAGAVLGHGGDALQPPRDEQVAWLAVELALALRWPLARWVSLHAELTPLIPVLRPHLRIDGLGSLHRSAPLAVAASAGLEVRLR